MRHFVSVLLIMVLAILASGKAAAEETYFAFGAEQIETGGEKQYAFVPFAFNGPREFSLERKVALIFEKIHGPRAAVYGDTYLILKETAAGQTEAWLTLDPSTERFHHIIVGEFYLTLANLGIERLHVSPWDRWVTDDDVIYPYFSPVVPIWEALPPAHYSHSVVRLAKGGLVPSQDFYERLNRKDKAVYDEIFQVLTGALAYPKLKVMDAFGSLAIPDPAMHLIPLLGDRNQEVKYKAINMLSSINSPKVLDALGKLADSDPDPEARLMAAKILVDAGRNNFKIYIMFEKLKSEDKAVILDTIGKLGASGDKRVLPALLGLLVHQDKDLRDAAFENVIRLDDLETIKGLLAMDVIEQAYRESAANTLLEKKEPEVSKVGIAYLLTKGSDKGRLSALEIIQMREYKDLEQELASLAAAPQNEIALKAIEVIEALKLTGQLDTLAQAAERAELKDKARAAISSLIAAMPLAGVLDATRSEKLVIRELAFAAAVPFSKDKKTRTPVIDALFKGMKDSEVVVRRAAATALLDTGDNAVLERMLTSSDDQDPEVRGIIVEAARQLASTNGDKIILSLIDDPDDKVKLAVVKAIGERGIKEAMAKLKFRVEHRDIEMRRAVLHTIVALNTTPEEHLAFMEIYQKAVFDPDAEIKLAGLEGLQWISDPNIVAILMDGTLTFHQDPRVRAKTIMGLGRSKDHNTIEAIARGLSDKDPMVKEAAIKALKILGHKNGLIPLEEFLVVSDDQALIQLAKEAIEAIKNPSQGLLD